MESSQLSIIIIIQGHPATGPVTLIEEIDSEHPHAAFADADAAGTLTREF
jgi:hypothetical protein